MTIVAHAHPYVIGVNTHARTHTLALVTAATGALVASEQFPSRPLARTARVPAGGGKRRSQEVSTHSTMTRSLADLANRLVDLRIELSVVASDIFGVSGRAMMARADRRGTRPPGARADGQVTDAHQDPPAAGGLHRTLR